MPAGGRYAKKKSQAPIFSQQFFIDNHADIFSCICAVICLGLMFQTTSRIANPFCAPQYNSTINRTNSSNVTEEIQLFHIGSRDVFTLIFYTMIWIIVHAVFHEYVWEKYGRRLHLSKTKTAEFYDNGNFVVFYFVSTVAGATILIQQEYLFPPSQLWRQYPDLPIRFIEKMYFILLIGFWLHNFPEVYLMKTKKEEIQDKLVTYVINLSLVLGHYVFGFIRLGIFFFVFHNSGEFFKTLSNLLQLCGKRVSAIQTLSSIWLVLTKISILAVAIAAYLFGLPSQFSEEIPIGFETGNFNLPTIRFPMLAGVMAVTLLQLWTFITTQLKSQRDEKSHRKTATSDHKERKKEEEIKKRKKISTNH
ncbi:translocating chain-associated membrane protein 1-like 1 [Oscarella lobularis]|uniref:translocating chain-associated membrane protein 1-like 1 n=1 Tax=Oscarella lobularis TaxID=121494 RepID=UPI0033134CDD